MSALDTLERIVENSEFLDHPFRYCLVADDKIPYSLNGTRAHPNDGEDFCSLEELSTFPKLDKYAGIGISIIESGISAIDVDKCFKTPFDINSIDERGKDILEMFRGKAYAEFSFSGKGLRILFIVPNVPNYPETYYIKNDKNHIEYYQPGNTARYVTITGRSIYNYGFNKMDNLSTIYLFLNKYMTRPKTKLKPAFTCDLTGNNELSLNELLKKVKSLYLVDIEFQDLWWGEAPGSGKGESEKDFHLLSILYNKVVEDKEKLRELFEASPYFSTKDKKHLNKWYYNNYRYFDYIYDHL